MEFITNHPNNREFSRHPDKRMRNTAQRHRMDRSIEVSPQTADIVQKKSGKLQE